MTKQDVRIEYQDFKDILELIINRLKNNAIVKTDEDPEYSYRSDYKNYSFILVKDKNLEKENITRAILNILSFRNNDKYFFHGDGFPDGSLGRKEFSPLSFEENENKYYIIVYDSRGLRVLLELNHYVNSLYKDTEKQNELMSLINDATQCSHPEDRKDFIYVFSFIFNNNRVYPEIKDNKDCYDEKEEMKNKNNITDYNANDTVILKTNIKSKCRELLKNKIKEYLNKEEYKTGGFKTILFNDIKLLLEKEFPIITQINNILFSKNLFNTVWKEVIEENPEYECLSKHGRRY